MIRFFSIGFCMVASAVFAGDLVTPVMTDEAPGPGKRVRQVAPEYGTVEGNVYP